MDNLAQTGTITANGQSVTKEVDYGGNVAGFYLWGTSAGVNVTFEGTPDNVNWYPLIAARVDSNQAAGIASGVITGVQAWEVGLPAAIGKVRARATAYTSGTLNVAIGFQVQPYEPVPTMPAAFGVTGSVYVANAVVHTVEAVTAAPAAGTISNGAIRDSQSSSFFARGDRLRLIASGDAAFSLTTEWDNAGTMAASETLPSVAAVLVGTRYVASIDSPVYNRYYRGVIINGAAANANMRMISTLKD